MHSEGVNRSNIFIILLLPGLLMILQTPLSNFESIEARAWVAHV